MIQAIHRARCVRGAVDLPGDKSISHRYALLGALAEGGTEIRDFATSRDCRSTLDCLRGLGVSIETRDDCLLIGGRGLRGLAAPEGVLDARNSGTTMRLLSGILAGHPFEASITGDESLLRRPMGRIAQPLRLMGATVQCRDGEFPPLTIRGGNLKGIRYALPVPSAQVKSSVLLAGLYGDCTTAVREVVPTRDHTEIALRQFGATVRRDNEWIEVDPEPRLRGQALRVPGDISSAAFFMVAAALVPGSDILLRDMGMNARRSELLNYLREAGLDIAVERVSEEAGEARGDVRVRHSPDVFDAGLPPIRGGMVAALIDEIPILAILGSQVAGGLELAEAHELRLKESDRISAIALNLRAMGGGVEEFPDGLRVEGRRSLVGADIDSCGDHRIAMTFAVAGLAAEGQSRIHRAECADVSYPGFYDELRKIVEL